MKTFSQFLTEASRPQEPRELMSFASADSNNGLTEDIRFNAKHHVNMLVKGSRNYPSDGSIAKAHTGYITSVSKLHKITDEKTKAILWKFAEACWDYELEKAGI